MRPPGAKKTAVSAAGFQIRLHVSLGLEHAQHDRAHKGKCDVRGQHAQLTDERAKGHLMLQGADAPKVASKVTQAQPASTPKASDPIHDKKVSVAVHAPHPRAAASGATWLKSREIKALMSP